VYFSAGARLSIHISQAPVGGCHEEGYVFMNANITDPDKFATFEPLSLQAMKHTVVSFWCVEEGARR
jgi:hypothetical protein